jgi:hypothetical protein
MTIKFLHMPLNRIDQLCKEHENENELVMVSIECYKRVPVIHHDTEDNGIDIIKIEDWLTSSYGCGIKSSKDVFQFDDEDMKQLADHVKEELR